jgi:DNA-binding MarR family transcriptional regulator
VQEQLLRAILATVARQTFPIEYIVEKVAVGTDKVKQVEAYNMCDGSKTQAEIAKHLGLDSSNFSKTVSRWIDLGILIKVGQLRETKLVHVYPIPALKKDK